MAKWIPLTNYENSSNHYMIMCKMKRNGMLRFRIKRISGIFHSIGKLPTLTNIDKQFDKILNSHG